MTERSDHSPQQDPAPGVPGSLGRARLVLRVGLGAATAVALTATGLTVLRPGPGPEPVSAATVAGAPAGSSDADSDGSVTSPRPPASLAPPGAGDVLVQGGAAVLQDTGGSRLANSRFSAAHLVGMRRKVVLSRQAAAAQRAADVVSAATRSPMTFRVGTFNVLGSWHTRPGRDAHEFGPGPMRAHWAAEVTRIYAPGVMGLNEIEPDQISVMAAELPQYSFYPGTSLGDPGVRNSVMWDNRRFTRTGQGYFSEPFVDVVRYNIYVRLRDNTTGRQFWVLNVHNSPNRGGSQTFEAQRRRQLRDEVVKVNQLDDSNLPVLLIGDMNDRDYTHCYIVSHSNMRPVQGGGNSCSLPPNSHIEWIFGSRRITWSDFKYDRGPLVAKTSDHHIMLATATIP